VTVSDTVSVMVTTFNTGRFVAETLQSILAQTYTNLEIVIADDASEDDTAAIIRKAASGDSRIVPLYGERNVGMSANVNRALDRCTGKYIALLSGDDIMLPEKIARQVAFLERRPDCGVCSHDMEYFESRTGRTLHRLHDRWSPKDGGHEVMFTTNWLFGREIKSIPSSHMFRASVIGRHRFDPRFRIYNEWLHEIDSMVTSGLRWGSLPDVLGRYRVHDRQTSQSPEAIRVGFEEMLAVLAVAQERYPELTPLIRAKRHYLLFSHLVFDWIAADRRDAYERQFRVEAGRFRWLYLKTAHAVVRRRWLMEATRPARRALARALGSS
jgi:glycosyltransferase involved in cell wall biosynthesis